MKIRPVILLGAIVLGGMSACRTPQHKTPPPPTEKQVRETFIKSNKMFFKQEADEINQYIKYHHWNMKETQTGLRYMIYKHGNGPLARIGEHAVVKYSISLLDGTVCYTSKKDGPEDFLIGEDYVEDGVHEGIQLMHVGDRARFIVPSYLGHGLLGDFDKIPPKAVVIYNIQLISLHK